MAPKEKAEELFEKYKYEVGDNCENSSYCAKSCQTKNGIFCFVDKQTAKQCALICVDEIIEELDFISELMASNYDWHRDNYWQQVKTEIETL